MKLTILGSSASTPKINKHTTSQLLKIKNHHILIDCGEGIQMQLRKLKVSFSKISHIFISHLHGDHYLGLIDILMVDNKDEENIPFLDSVSCVFESIYMETSNQKINLATKCIDALEGMYS